MFDVKSLFASKTFWGAIIMFAPTVASVFGLNMTAQDATDAVGHVQTTVTAVVETVGFLTVLWGRMTATKIATITGK